MLREAGGRAQGHSGLHSSAQTSGPCRRPPWAPSQVPSATRTINSQDSLRRLRGASGIWESGGFGMSLNQEPRGRGLPSAQLGRPSVGQQPWSPPRAGRLDARWHCDLAERRPPSDELPSGEASPPPRDSCCPCCPAQPGLASCLSHRHWGRGSKSSPQVPIPGAVSQQVQGLPPSPACPVL